MGGSRGACIWAGAAADAKPLSYDVVSVKQNKSGPGMMRIMNQPDRFATTNVGLKMVIQNAYGLKMPDMISGLPGWADSASFDIEAKMDAETVATLKAMPKEQADEQRRQMLQATLADRFKLKVHHETKELPIYSLVIAKGGFKLKDADPNSTYPDGIKGPDGVSRAGMMRMGGGKLTAQGLRFRAWRTSCRHRCTGWWWTIPALRVSTTSRCSGLRMRWRTHTRRRERQVRLIPGLRFIRRCRSNWGCGWTLPRGR